MQPFILFALTYITHRRKFKLAAFTMPEFRFRRKKHENRRTTVNNAEETAKQIQEAKKLVKPVFEPPQENAELSAVAEARETLGEGAVEGGEGMLMAPAEKRRNSFIQEREKFFELLKSKYPEQANSLEVGVVKMDGNKEDEEEREGDSSADKPMVLLLLCLLCLLVCFMFVVVVSVNYM